ncbi:MAG: HlyC/CorC family transporter [Lachnospiraceae bacterium]|nr:HlyC/CorC family transporter [Lachnospiraceae bacterium]
MQEYPILGIGIILGLFILNGIASAAETAFDQPLSTVIKKRVAEGDKRAKRVSLICDRRKRCTTILDLLRTVTVFLCGITYAELLKNETVPALRALFAPYKPSEVYVWGSLILITVAVVWLAELLSIKVPKKLGFKYAERFVFRISGFVRFFMILFAPLAFLAERMARGIAAMFGVHPGDIAENVTEEEIISIVTEGQEQGLLDEEEAEMITNVMDFDAKAARDVMTRKKKIIGIREEMSIEEALEFGLKENYSRFPIYAENLDNITGILHLKDLMLYFMEYRNEPEILRNTPLSDLAREPYFVPETQNIDVLLNDMQEKKIHMAVVIDEYGQTAGVVAMEDMLEEIVGDIQDEYDDEEQEIVPQNDGTWLVRGFTMLEELGDVLDVDFSEEEADTLNGFVISKLGRLPSEEETEYPVVTEYGYCFEICKVKGKQIDTVRVSTVVEPIVETMEQ